MQLTGLFSAFFADHAYLLRRAFRVALAIFIATWITHYLSRTEEYWIATSALMVMKTSLGAPLREHLTRFMVILACVVFSSLVLSVVYHELIFHALLISIFLVIWVLLAISYELEPTMLCLPLLIAALLLVAILSPYDPSSVTYNRVHDIIMGTFVGTVIGLLIFPDRVEVIFRKNTLSLLKLFSDFFAMLMTKFLCMQEFCSAEESNLMQAIFQSPRIMPSWVYHSGFNPGLKKSYRYFLSVMTQLCETLLSLHSLSNVINKQALTIFEPEIKQYTKVTQQLFDLIISRLRDEALIVDFSSQDFVIDINELEKKLQEHLPTGLEFLSASKEAVWLTAWARDLRELRTKLLYIAESVM